jgi:hypothetical protein
MDHVGPTLPPTRTRCKSAREVLFMQNRFGLQKVADGSIGERFIILLEAAGKDAARSKPMSESDVRSALHKMGNSDAAIASMFERARNISSEEPH